MDNAVYVYLHGLLYDTLKFHMNFCFLSVWRCQYRNKTQDYKIYKSKCKQIITDNKYCLSRVHDCIFLKWDLVPGRTEVIIRVMIQQRKNICLGDRFNNGKERYSNRELQSTKKERDTQVVLHPYITCVRVLKKLFSITCWSMKLHLIGFFTTQSCVIFTFQVGVIPHISLSLQAKGFFVARKWILQHLKKNTRTYQRLSQTRVYQLLNRGLNTSWLSLSYRYQQKMHYINMWISIGHTAGRHVILQKQTFTHHNSIIMGDML